MRLNSEQATFRFYQWEYLRGRGYVHFPFQVDLEPPFAPFVHSALPFIQQIDDGRIPSHWEKAKKLFLPEKPEAEEEVIEAYEDFGKKNLIAFKVIVRKGFKDSPTDSIELLNILSGTADPISFEIHASKEEIEFRIICSRQDQRRVLTQAKAYFTDADYVEEGPFIFPFENDLPIAICDFGLEQEFMRPMQSLKESVNDPLFNLLASLKNLDKDDSVVFQCIFKGVGNPWAQSIINSVHDPYGKPFFSGAPEMTGLAEKKVSNVLFAVVMRLVVQSSSESRIRYLSEELIHGISYGSQSGDNRLIPLSNEGYTFDDHFSNVINRRSNRLGMILNSEELASIAHFPNPSLLSKEAEDRKTKELPRLLGQGKYELGLNTHLNQKHKVLLNDEIRLRHSHIIGATGTGKSTLLSNLVYEDINAGNGLLLIDPHGDLIEKNILPYIPESRKDDVIFIDPSNLSYSIGLNLLEAKNEYEKLVLSSDMVGAIKAQSTAWGDNMTAVLSNAINAFLESPEPGTLFDLKRFLIEEGFRKERLCTVQDPTVVYFFTHEYPALRKGITPLLTRIDTFLRPKPMRSMFIQKSGIYFRACMDENKIILVKLSQGLIGKENSFLLGSLILSKLNQATLSRQDSNIRNPFYVYLDEFQNFITPSISEILEGSRKYSLGLVLAHQQLSQVRSSEIQESVLANCYTQICFRLGHTDASRLAHSYSGFEAADFTNLDTGQAIAKVGRSMDDFSLETELHLREKTGFEGFIREQTGAKYGLSSDEIDGLLKDSLPKVELAKDRGKKTDIFPKKEEVEEKVEPPTSSTISDEEKGELIDREIQSQEIREHNRLQSQIKRMAQGLGFISIIEKETDDGGRIDVYLEREGHSIGIEVSVTNKAEYEFGNITKCQRFGCTDVWMICQSENHLESIKKLSQQRLKKDEIKNVHFGNFTDFEVYLLSLKVPAREPDVEVVNGIRIKTEYDPTVSSTAENIKEQLIKLLYKG